MWLILVLYCMESNVTSRSQVTNFPFEVCEGVYHIKSQKTILRAKKQANRVFAILATLQLGAHNWLVPISRGYQ